MQQLVMGGESYYALSTMEALGIGGAALIIIVVLFLIFVLTSPVALPYLKAYLKGKYLLFVLDKTNKTVIKSPEFKNGVAHIKGTPARFVKNEFNGSYNLGVMKCDFAVQGTAHIAEHDYLSAFEVIESMQELQGLKETQICAFLTACINSQEFYKNFKSENPGFDLEIVIPAFSKIKLSTLARYIKLTPEDITSYVTGEIEQAKEPFLRKNELRGSSGKPIIIIGIIAAVAIIGLAVAKAAGMF